MSAIWHDSGLPSFLGVPPSFSFYEQAVVEMPAPISYQVAQQYLRFVQRSFGENFRYECARRAHEVYQRKRPWWVTVV